MLRLLAADVVSFSSAACAFTILSCWAGAVQLLAEMRDLRFAPNAVANDAAAATCRREGAPGKTAAERRSCSLRCSVRAPLGDSEDVQGLFLASTFVFAYPHVMDLKYVSARPLVHDVVRGLQLDCSL